jgi:hypothetical protein
VLLHRKRLALVLVLGTGALGSSIVTGTAFGAAQDPSLGDSPQWWSPAPRTGPPAFPDAAACRGGRGMRWAVCRINQRVARQCGGLRGRWRSVCVRRVFRSLTATLPRDTPPAGLA